MLQGEKRERLWLPNHRPCRVCIKPRLSSSSSCFSSSFSAFLRCSFTNMVPLAPRLPVSITRAARFPEKLPQKQVSQSRHGTGAFIFLIVGIGSKAISAGKWRGFPRHLFCLQNTQGLNQKKRAAMGRVAAQHA